MLVKKDHYRFVWPHDLEVCRKVQTLTYDDPRTWTTAAEIFLFFTSRVLRHCKTISVTICCLVTAQFI